MARCGGQIQRGCERRRWPLRTSVGSSRIWIAWRASLATSASCLLLWCRRRHESMLLCFGLAALALATDLSIELFTAHAWSGLSHP
jgi:hypothetical protein